jgi:WD40 repeat protein
VPVSFDTVYGGAWSPDGKLVSFGCTDNSVRAIEAATGTQVLFQGAHEDWVLDTVFSPKGDHVISVGRDMSVKLTELATQRFVDNVTSITPGALRGGLQAIDRPGGPGSAEVALFSQANAAYSRKKLQPLLQDFLA